MSIYDNETSKIDPDLNSTAPQGPDTYQLNKLYETESFFLDEVKVRGQNAKKKKKQFNTIAGIVDTSLITSAVITGGTSTAAFSRGVGLPVGIVLGVLA